MRVYGNSILQRFRLVKSLPADADRGGASAQVRVRIEEEDGQQPTPLETNDPALGIWRDREDMADVQPHVRKLREPRYSRGGTLYLP